MKVKVYVAADIHLTREGKPDLGETIIEVDEQQFLTNLGVLEEEYNEKLNVIFAFEVDIPDKKKLNIIKIPTYQLVSVKK